jgi:hypothetical protein
MTDTPWLDCMDGFEEAARREAANKAALESLGIDYESFGQKPWNEGDLDYEAPNGDYIKTIHSSIV